MAVSKEHGGVFLIQLALKTGLMLPGSRWLFLGNQRVKEMGRIISVKPMMEMFGAEVILVDVNDKDYSVVHDLRTPFPDSYVCSFDVMANFGTSEHVIQRAIGRPLSGQHQCFANAHNAAKPGGLYLHAVPHAGGCVRHGSSKYSVPWFADLAKNNLYEVLHLDTVEVPHDIPGDNRYVVCAMRRPKRIAPFNSAAWVDPPSA